MIRPWRLTRQAQGALIEIAEWTVATFGPRQADAYEADLILACQDIASGRAISRDCSSLIDDQPAEALRFTRAGQHFIVFVETDDRVVIVDFLHARSDLPRRVAALSDLKPGDDL